MALNPRGTRQRDGAAQLAQFQKENRLFDETSSSGVSPVFEVWNEPVVIHVHNLAPGQGVAVDCVSDYDNNPVYTPFTPVRGVPLILDEDLTSVILFYSGRYVLRLTGGGLGTIKAFCYPFSVSHDWGDYYASLGTGGNVVRSLDEIDTNTINITLNPDPGIGDVTIRADAVLSPDARNILEFRANGMYARGPNNGNIEDAIVGAIDTNTIDHTVAANILSSQVIRSPDAGQILELRVNGVYVPGPQNGNPQNVPTSVLDTQSVDLTLAANVLSADVIISPDAGNSLELRANGLFSVGFAGTITTATDTNTIDHTVTAGVLTSQVIRSPDAGNLIELRANGVYSGVGNAVTSVTDTQSIDLTLAANNLQADLRIDPSAENVLNLGAPGVLVEAATTAEEEAETAGDLVITAAVLGHIVNARTAQQSAHLGVGAGNLATRQVSVGHNAGTGTSGAGAVAVGANAGQNVLAPSTVYIGDGVGPGSGSGNDSANFVVRIGTYAPVGNSRYSGQSVLIGGNYDNALNQNAAIVLPPVTIVGAQAASFVNFNNFQSIADITAVGRYALGGAILLNNGGMAALGSFALANSKVGVALGVGANAGSNFNAANTSNNAVGLSALGALAAAGAYGYEAFNADLIDISALGSAALFNAKFPLKTYSPDLSKIANVSISEVSFIDDRGVEYDVKQPAYSYGEAVDFSLYYGFAAGGVAGIASHFVSSTAVGFSSCASSYAAFSVVLGSYSGHTAALEETTVFGDYAHVGAKSLRSVFVGAQAGNPTIGSAISASFTGAAFNNTDVATIPVHSLAIGEYHTVRFEVLAGSAPSNLANNTFLVVYALNNTQLRLVRGNVASGGVGTYQFSVIIPRTNCIAIGYQAENDKDNQISLGNSDTEELRTAGKVYPGAPAGGFQNAAGMYGGTGAPNNAHGSNGDFYFRSDGGALTSIYHKRAGSWVGIV